MDNNQNEPMVLTFCMENESILISKPVLEAIGEPKHIQLLINPGLKKIMLQSCAMNDECAVVIPNQNFTEFAMSGHIFLKKIWKMMDWDDSNPRVLCGVVVPGKPAVLFDLEKAQTAEFKSPTDRTLN